MKALSIKQPWANLIADGQKGIEIRTWATTYEGPLLIHASKSVDKRATRLFRGVTTSPRGVVLAQGYLTMCVHYTKVEFIQDQGIHLNPVTWWKEGLFGWLLVEVKRLNEPVKWKGQLGLFEVNLKRR